MRPCHQPLALIHTTAADPIYWWLHCDASSQHYSSKIAFKMRWSYEDLHLDPATSFSYPGLVFLSEWWVARRGFAGSIMFAGWSICIPHSWISFVWLGKVDWSVFGWLRNFGLWPDLPSRTRLVFGKIRHSDDPSSYRNIMVYLYGPASAFLPVRKNSIAGMPTCKISMMR